ncbi:MAG: hydroxyisourate hydrolase [Hymenobacteraceae bacterium]|nr:hydroxyisourate hydrolase [Hymenobacteraceae bacterium]MDX5480074.1 hydroxyisourate hydrolase [Hymenobacteraceae bacterium]
MKKALIVLLLLCTLNVFAQESKHQLSTHILDITTGTPAAGVPVRLEKYEPATKAWRTLATKVTDKNGRVGDYLPQESGASNKGTYKLVFLTADYFSDRKMETFYPYIEVVFEISGNSYYHVPITLSPFGYSTYRGS